MPDAPAVRARKASSVAGPREPNRGAAQTQMTPATLPTVRSTVSSSTEAPMRTNRLRSQCSTVVEPPPVYKSHPAVRALAVRSDGAKYGRLIPLTTPAPAPVETSSEVLQSIAGLRRALRTRATTTSAPCTSALNGDELTAAKGMLTDMGRRGLSTEELLALTGVEPDAAPAKPTGPLKPTPPPPASTKPSHFSARTKVRSLLAPEKLLIEATDVSPSSGAYASTMAGVEAAVDSHDAAVQRARVYASRVRTLVEAWERLRDGAYDTMADKVMSRMVAAAPPLTDTPISGTCHEEALALMGMVGRAVMAFTSPEDTVEVTIEMGAKHNMYGVVEAHYAALRQAFMTELPNYLPKDIYDSSLHLWQTMWAMITSLLLSGASSDRGAFYAQRKHELWVAIVQKTLTEVVRREMGGPQDERKHPFIMHLYDRGVAADPSMRRYFLLREVRNSDRAMDAVIRIVTNLHDMPAVDTFLEELGIRHIEYDMTEKTLKAYRQPFLDTCAQYIGMDEEFWNPDSIKALGQLWDYVVQKWAIGFNVNKKSMSNANAPDTHGGFCLLFTDIEASTKLWEKDRTVMRQAVKNHHRVIRALIADFDGYEVKTIGDSFMIACKDALIALKIAIGIQLEFMRTPTTQDFEMVPHVQGFGDASCWRSDAVRVRIGIHYCTHANAVYDPVQRRYDYYGPDVNLAARTEAAACGGQILITEEMYTALKAIDSFTTEPRHRLLAGISTTVEKGSEDYVRPLSDYVNFADIGWRDMKGIADRVHLFSATPVALAGRLFPSTADTSMQSSRTSNTFGIIGFASRTGHDGSDDSLVDLDDDVVVKPARLEVDEVGPIGRPYREVAATNSP